jgi:thiol-disulfide isomerase/thioredoxin
MRIFMKWIKKITVLMMLMAGLLVVGPAPLRAATKVPDFSLSALSGKDKTIDIRAYRGKVVLVVFWATWCQPCMQEVPSLISLQKEFGPQGFSVIGLSVDEGGSSAVTRVVKKTGINYPVAIASSKVGRDFGGIVGIPTAFMVDRSGNVVKRYSGWTSHEVIAGDLKRVLK